MKTAPGIPHHLVPEAPSAMGAVDGDVVEAGLWFGLLARDGVRRARWFWTARAAAPRWTDDGCRSRSGRAGGVLYGRTGR